MAKATFLFNRIALSLFALCLMTSAAFAKQAVFTDVSPDHPYFLAIDYLNEAETIGGYSDGTFLPDAPINRAEVLKITLKGLDVAILAPEEGVFPDVSSDTWFAPYVVTAHSLGIVKGDSENGHFVADRTVNKAEFLKMLLLTGGVEVPSLPEDAPVFEDVPLGAWFAPYIHRALQLGIITPDDQNLLFPGQLLSRGEVAEILYLFTMIQKGDDTQFLLDRTEDQLKQIEVYIAANQVALAKKTSVLGVDLSQQAFRNMSSSPVVLGAAKLARAYDYLVDAYALGTRKDYEQSAQKANDAIDKATEAWEANNATQPIARHIKDRAREILTQVGGIEE